MSFAKFKSALRRKYLRRNDLRQVQKWSSSKLSSPKWPSSSPKMVFIDLSLRRNGLRQIQRWSSSTFLFIEMAFVKSKDGLRRHFSSPKWASSSPKMVFVEIIFVEMTFIKSKDGLRRHFSSPKWASSKDHNALSKHFISQILYANGSSASITRAASLCVQVSNIDRRDTPNGRCAIYSAHDAVDAVHLGPPRLRRRWTRRKNTQARRTQGLIP